MTGLEAALDVCTTSLSDILIPLSDVLTTASPTLQEKSATGTSTFTEEENEIVDFDSKAINKENDVFEFQEIELSLPSDDSSPVDNTMGKSTFLEQKQSEIEDDIGWFFDDGKVPEFPQIEQSIIDAISKMDVIMGDVTNMSCGVDLHNKMSINQDFNNDTDNDLFLLSVGQTNASISRSIPDVCILKNVTDNQQFSSLKGQSDDDFDDCFDSITTENQKLLDGDSDEFESCFDDTQFVECETNPKSNGGNYHIIGPSLSCRELLKCENSQIGKQKRLSQNQSCTPPPSDMPVKLEQLLKIRSEGKDNKIRNQSRHLETVQSTNEELESSKGQMVSDINKMKFESQDSLTEVLHGSSIKTPNNIPVPEIPEIKVKECDLKINNSQEQKDNHGDINLKSIEERLAEILATKTKPSTRVLNQSKHFKTIQSTVEELCDTNSAQESLGNEISQINKDCSQVMGCQSDPTSQVVGLQSGSQTDPTSQAKGLPHSYQSDPTSQVVGFHNDYQGSDQSSKSIYTEKEENTDTPIAGTYLVDRSVDNTSRHLHVSDDKCQITTPVIKEDEHQEDQRKDTFRKLVRGLSHGNEEVVALVTDSLWNQCHNQTTDNLK